MRRFLENQLKKLKNFVVPLSVSYGNSVLPPREVRLCGSQFQQDEYFMLSAEKEADRLIKEFGLRKGSRVLDLGCGFARLPIGILSRVGNKPDYFGFDVMKSCVRWGTYHITRKYPNFKFMHLNLRNDRYNPKGVLINEKFRFPFSDRSFDIIYLYSVFSHMVISDIEMYLKDFSRLLRPKGKVFLTAFVEDSVPDISINPEGYWLVPSGPLHCVRYQKSFFESLLAKQGFNIDVFHYGAETDGQSAYGLSLGHSDLSL